MLVATAGHMRDQVAALAERAAALAREVGGKGFTAAQYRDAIGIGAIKRSASSNSSTASASRVATGDCRNYYLIVGNDARLQLDNATRPNAP